MRVNHETYAVEDADGLSQSRRQHLRDNTPVAQSLPWAPAHIETPRKFTEQERPNGNPETGGARMRGKTGVFECKRPLGVGLFHSSDEACEGSASGRAGGAKERAGQGTRWGER